VSWKRTWYLAVAILLFATSLTVLKQQNAWAVSGVCELCIVELQTTGLNSATEDYVVIANNTSTSIDLSGVIIKYITAGGTANSKTINLSGSLPAHMASVFVGSGLQAANPSLASFPTGLALADGGGTLQILKSSSVIDEVSWGTITKAGFSGTVAAKHLPGASLIRQQLSDGSFMDSGNNATDFAINTHACAGLSLNEIQPFVIDELGNDLTPSVEILKTAGASIDQDCPLFLNGQKYGLAAGDLSQENGLTAIQNVIDAQNQVIAIPLMPDSANDLQFVSSSYYGQISEPLATSGAKLQQPQLLAGQSYAKFSSGWKATYSPTIGGSNKLATSPVVAQAQTYPAPSDECEQVVINEILPNPLGDDAGNEWLELKSLVNRPVNLAACALSVNGSLYQFGADVFVNPGELPVYKDFSNGETTRALNLKNSDTSTISFGRLNVNGTFEPLQTFQYKDAVEGQTWARFEEGWRWISPNPGLDNATPATTSSIQPTEFAASSQILGDQITTSVSNPAATIQITELLPNPATPQTDEEDEFVELYNPSNEPIDVTGYKIEAGSTFAYNYSIPSGSIGPHEYSIFSSGNSSLSLANSAGQARLLNTDGQIVSTTDPYKDAPEGQAWALIDGAWMWTASPTPALANTYLAPPLSLAAAKTAKKASAKTKAKPKATTAKKAATKAAKKSSGGTSGEEQESAPLHMPVLVGVGASALLYAAYEYRQDFANALHKLRRNRGFSRTARQTA
jgi:hypothetical protein